MNGLNQMNYHHYQQHPAHTVQTQNSHQIDQTMHLNDTANVDCHTVNVINGTSNNGASTVHKTEDILLSSTIAASMPLSNSVSGMMLPSNDMIIHQNVSNFIILCKRSFFLFIFYFSSHLID